MLKDASSLPITLSLASSMTLVKPIAKEPKKYSHFSRIRLNFKGRL